MAKERRTTERSHRDNKKRDMFSQVDGDTPLQPGLIIRRFGQQADIQPEHGAPFRCHLRKHLISAAVGDRIEWQPDHDGHGVIVNILPRRSELQRPNPYEGLKTIAANIDHLLVMVSPVPAFSETLLDRYLVAAEQSGISISIVLNKCDLLNAGEHAQLQQRLQLYRDLNYLVFEISTRTGAGIETLRGHMQDGTSVIIGQSGVGKSSLVNALLPLAEAEVGDVSSNSDLGQHTTTAARLFFLNGGGQLIDSPGIREFGLWHLPALQITKGFRDIARIAHDCKFRDCVHQKEPGCAVQAAVASGELSAARFASYTAIISASAPE